MIVSKIRCVNPNLKAKSIVSNRNHLVYIATREGVDLSIEVSSRAEDSENEAYLKYISERPRSHGLFGNLSSDLQEMSSKVYSLSKQGTNIYRGILSLKEEDAVALGFDNKKAWMSYMDSVMPGIAERFKIPLSHFQWVAAIHMEPGHPHCHYMFWDNEQGIKSPFIHPSIQNSCREFLSGKMYEEKLAQEAQLKTVARDETLKAVKALFSKDAQYTKIPSHPKEGFLKDITFRFSFLASDLSVDLPDRGRMNYQFMDPHIKKQLDLITDLLLTHPSLKKEWSLYKKSVDQMSLFYSASEEHAKTNMLLAKEDLYKRIGNIVLKNVSLKVKEHYHETKEISSYYMKGLSSLNAGDNEKNILAAEKAFLMCAEKGHLPSMYRLGKLYLDKLPNLPMALFYLERAAAEGHEAANLTLGVCYYFGKYGLNENKSKGSFYLSQAAASGNDTAQNILAGKDMNFSYRLFRTALMSLGRSRRKIDHDLRWDQEKDNHKKKRKKSHQYRFL